MVGTVYTSVKWLYDNKIVGNETGTYAEVGPGRDGHEVSSTGGVAIDRSILNIGDFGSGVTWMSCIQFPILIPRGATVSEAKLDLYLITLNGTPNLRIYGEDTNNAAKVVATTNNISNRTLTTAYVDWNPTSTEWNTIDITNIVQEIVNRSGFVSGNISIIFKDNGGASNDRIQVYAWNNGENIPKLTSTSTSYGIGLGTVTHVRDYSIDKYWESATLPNTFYFNFGTALRLDAFAMVTGDDTNGTIFIGYGNDSTASLGTVLVNITYGTAKKFFDVGTYQYWRIGLYDPQDLKQYDASTITYDESTVTYDSLILLGPSQMDEIFLGRFDFFGEEPIYPFERSITYAHSLLETSDGKKHEFHKFKKHSWHFNYANVRASTKDNIMAFHGTTSGEKNPFWLSISDNETGIFIGHIDQNSFTFNEITKNVWNVSFDVEEES